MKKLLFLLIFCLSYSFAQTQIFTQDASNKYKYYSAATTGDTLVTKTAAPSGSSIVNPSMGGAYLVGIMIGKPVSMDTIIIKNGVGTVATIILDSVYTAVPSYHAGIPYFIPIPTRLDTSLIYIQKKASLVTLIYQTRKPQ